MGHLERSQHARWVMAKTRRRKVSFTALLRPGQARKLDSLSDVTLVRKAEIVRLGVDLAIAKLEKQLDAEELGWELLQQREASDGKR
jgi:hypothetical protein